MSRYYSIVAVLLITTSVANAQRIYWADNNAKRIAHVNIDGSDIQYINLPDCTLNDVAVANGKLYWGCWTENEIWRADLDGTNAELIVDGVPVGTPMGIAVSTATGNVPAVSTWGLIVMMLMLVTVGTVVIGRRRVVEG